MKTTIFILTLFCMQAMASTISLEPGSKIKIKAQQSAIVKCLGTSPDSFSMLFCSCSTYELKLHYVNLKTGEKKFLETLQTFGNRLDCPRAMTKYSVCQKKS